MASRISNGHRFDSGVGVDPSASTGNATSQHLPTLRILVVSEVRLCQEGVARALRASCSLQVIGATDPGHAVAHNARLRPQIVLFDATRPSSLETARRLAAAISDTKLVAFGLPESDQEVLAFAAAGIAGYVRQDASAQEVAAALHCVMRDELLCSPRVAASLYHRVAMLSRGGLAREAVTLTRREREIARLIDRGLSNKDIARQLGIEATTVKNHVHNILDKLKVRRRGEAAARIRGSLGPAPP